MPDSKPNREENSMNMINHNADLLKSTSMPVSEMKSQKDETLQDLIESHEELCKSEQVAHETHDTAEALHTEWLARHAPKLVQVTAGMSLDIFQFTKKDCHKHAQQIFDELGRHIAKVMIGDAQKAASECLELQRSQAADAIESAYDELENAPEAVFYNTALEEQRNAIKLQQSAAKAILAYVCSSREELASKRDWFDRSAIKSDYFDPDTYERAFIKPLVKSYFGQVDNQQSWCASQNEDGTLNDDHDDEMSDADLAEMQFDAWEHTDDEWKPLTNEQWINEINPTLVSVRLAWVALHKTKDELVKIVSGMEKDELFERYMGSINDAADFFKGHLMMLEAARARLICAGLNVSENEVAINQ